MAIKGSLEEASLPDVLQLLSMGRKTGRLSVTDWTNLGYIYVDGGRITYATLVNRRDRLGDILLKSGKITREQLSAALQVQERDPNKKLGQALLETGAIDRAELEQHVRVQIEEAAYFLFTWRRGNFTFESDVQPEEKEFLVSIEPESLLLEGARRTDEWTLVEKKIPSFDLVFKVDEERLASSDVSLSGHQKQLVPLLDGTRNVAALIDESGLVEFDVGKAIYELVNAGLAHATGRRKTESSLTDAVDADATVPEKDGESEHYDYVQLATYLARDGEFADADRRKEAALHITDCAVCSGRLREMHRRRSASIDIPPDEPTDGESGGGHLSDVDLFTYVSREGEYTSAERRKLAAQHIADCSACTKRLKKIHRRRTGSVSGATQALGVHFDDVQLITYAAREGEFVDPQRRREVAFHIADCSSCSKRLKAIHRKRKQQTTAEAAAPEATATEEQQKVESVPERRSGIDRRLSDGTRRRASGDRRTLERRSGRDRRVAERRRKDDRPGRRKVERRSGVDRRCGDRRISDRRISDRRSAVGGWPVPGDRGGGEAMIASVAASGAATIAAVGTGAGIPAPMPRRRQAPQAQRAQARETENRIALDSAVSPRVEHGVEAPAGKPGAASGRVTQSGTPTRTDRPAAGAADLPGIMKEQTESLVPPKTEFKLLESERKSLAGLPLLDIDSSAPKVEEPRVKKQAGAPVEAPVARGAEAPSAAVEAEARKPMPETTSDAGAEAAKKAAAVAGRTKAVPSSLPAGTPARQTEPESTPAAGSPAPVRGTPVSLRRPGDDWESLARAPKRGTPRSLRELEPELPMSAPIPQGAPAGAKAPPRWSSSTRWQALGRWAAVVAVAVGAWFGRPIIQSLFGGADSRDGAPELAATGAVTGGETQPTVSAEATRSDSAGTAAARDSSGRVVPIEPTESRQTAQPTDEARATRRVDAREARPVPEVPVATRERAAVEEVPEQPEPATPPEPAPPSLSGTVRAAGSGNSLSGVRITIPGEGLATMSDLAGTFTFGALPAGSLSVVAELEGYVPASEDLVATPGNDVVLNLVLRRPPTAAEPDEELAGDQWQVIGPDEAESILARPAPVIAGLWLESLAKPTTGTRPRVRVAQLTSAGERITLTVTRAGPPVRNPIARVTAMRVIPPTEAYPVTTGTASYGNLLVTAKASVSADSLRAMLGRLIDSGGG